MGTVYPISTIPTATPTSASANDTANATSSTGSGQVDENMFLKLLVAQMKYQDPMNPTDSTQFLTQTAQFTQLETLQKMETEQAASERESDCSRASSMVGRQVTYALSPGGQAVAPTGTTIASIRGTLPNDAITGTKAQASTSVYTNSGVKIPLTLDFTKTDTGWSVQPSSGGLNLGSALPMTFDATGELRSGDLGISAGTLDDITGTRGDWPASGITLGFGDSGDPTRVQLASGAATVAVAEQNGNDGTSATGVVTGVHVTADGPQLVIGGQNIPYTSVTDVQN